ncbi:MAG: ABC transporter permease, partial [Alphaproteobacteria bacterium]|nr:ABC transporter permease [Alphaproteobacteria bacterium]
MPGSTRGSAMADSVAATGRLQRLWRGRTTRRLRRHRLFMTGLVLFAVFVVVGLLADVLAPTSPNAMSLRNRFQSPGAHFPFGTDNFGRDVLSRVIHGARVSLLVGLFVAALTTVFGVIIGAVAGYFSRLDAPVIGVMDAFMAFPTILLAIGISTALGPS